MWLNFGLLVIKANLKAFLLSHHWDDKWGKFNICMIYRIGVDSCQENNEWYVPQKKKKDNIFRK